MWHRQTASSWFSGLKPYFLCHGFRASHDKALIAMKHLEESDVGISFYISQLPGFRGILKQRSLRILLAFPSLLNFTYLWFPEKCGWKKILNLNFESFIEGLEEAESSNWCFLCFRCSEIKLGSRELRFHFLLNSFIFFFY